MLKTPFFFLFLCFATICQAQIVQQTIRGQVMDHDNQMPLIGATINVLPAGDHQAAITDEAGNFRLEKLASGRHQIEIHYIGYESLLLSEILLESGKEEVLNISLRQLSSELKTVVVSAQIASYDPKYIPTSIHALSIEETQRFPANFNDPARLAVAFAGVSNTNDQANGLSIRGQSPNNINWLLEGAEIVNPNHLTNAGTLSDRPTANAGGVNILSAQLLGTSNFLKGAFPASYGNALSGIMDMRLRNGNNEQHEFTGSIGLLGIDLAAEGPFSKQNKSSYLVNYRYSTIGLLSALGVQLGDEDIRFQDLALHLNFPLKIGSVKVFGLFGRSTNTFEAFDPSEWEFDKDSQNIEYKNDMFAIGTKWQRPLNEKTRLETTVAFSGIEASHIQQDVVLPFINNTTLINQKKLSLYSTIQHKLNPSNRLLFGTNIVYQTKEAATDTQRYSASLLQAFANWQWTPNIPIQMNIGLRYHYLSLDGQTAIAPRASLTYLLPSEQSISFAYSLQNQAPSPELIAQEKNLDFLKAHHLVLNYTNRLSKNTSLHLEAYYQSLFDIPVEKNVENSFSAINLIDGRTPNALVSNGKGWNYGIEASFQQHLTNGYYYLLNATWYRSEYEGSDKTPRSTRFDGNYIANATAGKEWTWDKKEKRYIIGANARFTYLGSFRDSPIDEALSALSYSTVYQDDLAFSLVQKDYYKLDLRVYFKRNKQKYSSTIALDIQNATNAENAAFRYYDVRQQAIVLKNQLGLIPNLSYKIEF